jgi:stearoyl-CoA desaturase (delta-9 desaturase)
VRKVVWWRITPYLLIHLLALGAFFYPFTPTELTVFLVTYSLKMFGVAAGFHRYFSHRSFRLSRLGAFIFGFLGCLAQQNGPLWWAAHHRVHHRHSDTQGDLHSPSLQGFWWSQVFWIFANREIAVAEVRDFQDYPELQWLNHFHFVPALALGVGLAIVYGFPAFIWGFSLSTVACWHATSGVNTIGHSYGSAPNETGDQSRNNWILALVTLGDGWHNNHHFAMNRARHGVKWWELDITYVTLKFLSWFGIVRDLREK